MAINFPTSPTVNQTYSYNGRTWIWNGNSWNLDIITTANLAFNQANAAFVQANTANTAAFSANAASGVTAATYGGATQIGVFTVDTRGKITSASNVAVSAGSQTISSQTAGNFTAGDSTDQTLYVVSANSAVCTLPAASAVSTGFRIIVKNASDGLSVTLARASSDTIDGVTSFRVPGRELVEVTKTADNTWTVTKRPTFQVGDIMEWGTNTLKEGGYAWLNAQTLSRTTYAGLFAEWGTTYGTGDGSTTFGVRDDRGRTKAGKDDMGGASAANRLTSGGAGINGTTLGASGGTQTHTLVTGEIPSHSHTLSLYNAGAGTSQRLYNGTNDSDNSEISSDATGGGGAHNNVQPTIIANFIVKT